MERKTKRLLLKLSKVGGDGDQMTLKWYPFKGNTNELRVILGLSGSPHFTGNFLL